ncbi:vinorine synthase-like [Ipomoea triloba]|uniref:vinorine synthase-like n=1 Tax=Ipomoea triloba TaxID=35885 RepID=UPI00125D5BDD|nr:vinorine synthase-like [Ipomoea triloba]
MIEIVSAELIKPSSPTPPSLQRLSFSMLDQLSPSNYVPMAFYYPAAEGDSPTTISVQLLKTSLSQILTKFYPLAGRINGNAWIDCSDQGAAFVVARASCPLSSFLVRGSEPESARRVLPIGVETNDPFRGCALIIQMTMFPCGGAVIGVRVCHKICDASSRTVFVNAWAAVCRGDTHVTAAPEFISTKLFPPPPPPLPNRDGNPRQQTITSPSRALELKRDESLMTKKYVFSASSVLALKAKGASEQVPKPSRVEAVTALLWKCAIKARKTSHNNHPIHSVMTQAVNLRKRLHPPLPDSCIGNLILCYAPFYQNRDSTNNEVPELRELVAILRRGLSEMSDKYVERLRRGGDEANRAIAECFREIEEITGGEGAEVYRFTSWCGFPIYEADFGGGAPACVGIAASPFKNVGVLMDAKDGCGVEAWLCLSAHDMESIDTNNDLLASLHCD